MRTAAFRSFCDMPCIIDFNNRSEKLLSWSIRRRLHLNLREKEAKTQGGEVIHPGF